MSRRLLLNLMEYLKFCRRRAIKDYTDIKKQMEIDRKDERNVAIVRRVKARGYDIKKLEL
ncbi:MAG: hypothetical protein LKE46_06640 [Clostridium sp.]|uniref:hypothetical protein n=1 Tax=Clostridium sp. TaxID=1506 RepID=UPI0025BFC760|nr:hypothetical protein [Clostridium sp.]MCH3963935.1 hypothetical protein [Clostridium sp.]MCI1716136.1 hypothetical protein [Clostridium sp.]MCI1800624.1 hypothetical protein [Clostridium sp.]MCI1814313.1 hypothetical protein [Clostridium sp.]MCI1871212.1 hypothetical protein [Clostridium sp.]